VRKKPLRKQWIHKLVKYRQPVNMAILVSLSCTNCAMPVVSH